MGGMGTIYDWVCEHSDIDKDDIDRLHVGLTVVYVTLRDGTVRTIELTAADIYPG
jgi:hypothetical protein